MLLSRLLRDSFAEVGRWMTPLLKEAAFYCAMLARGGSQKHDQVHDHLLPFLACTSFYLFS